MKYEKINKGKNLAKNTNVDQAVKKSEKSKRVKWDDVKKQIIAWK